MIDKVEVQEEIYLKELERLMSRRPDLVKAISRDEVRQWSFINGLKIYKDKDQSHPM